MVPAPYSVRWTSKLIRRDLKAIAANYTSKVRGIFSRSTDAAVAIPRDDFEDASLLDTERVHDVASVSSPTRCASVEFTSMSISSTDAALASSASSFSSTTADSDANACTEETDACLNDPTTLYSLLSTKLKDLYASRERDLPLSERWLFRGAWLILHMATQQCASNPSHNISKPGSSFVNETALLLEVLRKSTSIWYGTSLISLAEYSFSKPPEIPVSHVSQMSTMPCTKRKNKSSRQDSIFSTVSSTVSDQPPPSVPLALLWYTIFAGASDQLMTVYAAERLINHAWAGKDATAILEVVGNPAKRLPEEDDSELRRRFGYVLHPHHNSLGDDHDAFYI